MVVSFEKLFISPDFLLNFRKSHQISRSQLKSYESHGEKPEEDPLDGLRHFSLNDFHARDACKGKNSKEQLPKTATRLRSRSFGN